MDSPIVLTVLLTYNHQTHTHSNLTNKQMNGVNQYTHTSINIHTHAHTLTSINTHKHTHTYTHTHIHTWTDTVSDKRSGY